MMYRHSPYGSKPPSTEAVARHLRTRLLNYFQSVCPERHEIQIPVTASENPAHSDVDLVLQFELLDSLSKEAHFTIDHVGGNVFEVSGGLPDRSPKRFPVSCVSSSSPDKVLASVEESIGEFLLRELTHAVGTHVLRGAQTADAVPA